ncbi:MAG TPA: hypothetical protein VLH59_00780 [Ignavibacteriaceae bacterium]|nr:hypothetical protein [Ignavibacteriaceae bacterium]
MRSQIFLKLKLFFFTLLSLAILIGCEEETPNEPPAQDFPDYYPDGSGSTFKYSVTEKDSVGNILQSGTRNILFSGSYNLNGIDYTTQDDSLDFGSQSNVATYLFRKTETAVFYAVDTSQIAQLIPDTLKQFVTLRDEMQLLFYPLTTGSSWSLYRITAQVQPGIEVKILDIAASFVVTEQIDLNLTSGTKNVTAQKVKYTVELYSEIGSPPQTYTAFMWYAADVGLVKFEGNQFVVNIGGGGIIFEPSPNILTQEIIDFNSE